MVLKIIYLILLISPIELERIFWVYFKSSILNLSTSKLRHTGTWQEERKHIKLFMSTNKLKTTTTVQIDCTNIPIYITPEPREIEDEVEQQ